MGYQVRCDVSGCDAVANIEKPSGFSFSSPEEPLPKGWFLVIHFCRHESPKIGDVIANLGPEIVGEAGAKMVEGLATMADSFPTSPPTIEQVRRFCCPKHALPEFDKGSAVVEAAVKKTMDPLTRKTSKRKS